MQIKSDLRKQMISKRNDLDCQYRMRAGNSISENPLLLEQLRSADTVLCYISIGSEMPTNGIIDYCLKNGIKIAAPVCKGDNILFRYITSYDDLAPGSFSIPEPKSSCPAAMITPSTVCITPAVCYNENGFRIGYGKGYYDRFFAQNKCVKVGLCYEESIVDFDPEENDVAVDMIVTEHRFRRLNNGQ